MTRCLSLAVTNIYLIKKKLTHFYFTTYFSSSTEMTVLSAVQLEDH